MPIEDIISKYKKINGENLSNPRFYFIVHELLKATSSDNKIPKRKLGILFGRKTRISNNQVSITLRVLSEARLIELKKKDIVILPKLKELMK